MQLYDMVSHDNGRCSYRHEVELVLFLDTQTYGYVRTLEVLEERGGFQNRLHSGIEYHPPRLTYRGQPVQRQLIATTASYVINGEHRPRYVDEVIPAAIWPNLDRLVAPEITEGGHERRRQQARFHRLRRAWRHPRISQYDWDEPDDY